MPAQPSHNAHQPPSGDDPAAEAAGLRADARHNRERILEAARETFTHQGIDVPLSAVARRAGVGVATLYRRFPTRAALVTATFTEQLTQCAAALDDALSDPDPWHGLRLLLEKVCTMQATDRGFAGAFLAHFPDTLDHEHRRARAEDGLSRLVQRARDTGQLRADFDLSDITLLLLANGSLAGQPKETALTASQRLLAYFLQSMRSNDHAEPLPPAAPMGLQHIHPHTPRS
ncbi:helix-turn-helix domain-containing protein [Streptomyces sp. NPDC005251]|uniref:TetR/AcrR family transcriptional regulator n=1 Tax=unclassified Streptomyces TaxID=2593676 RepID=UPI0033A68067